MASSSWVDDFNSFQSSTDTMAGLSTAKGIKKPQSKKEVIEAELKLLEWHKLANEAAIRTALLQTKSLKKSSDPSPPSQLTQDAKWIKAVIEEEHVKPLEVTRDYVKNYDEREARDMDAQARQVSHHISTLSNLRTTLEKKVDLKARTLEYRDWKREFIAKKEAVMLGKTLDELEPATSSNFAKNDAANSKRGASSGMSRQVSRGSQELATVLDSLNKLAELEKRISSLESNNQYDALKGKEGLGPKSTGPIDFKKKRTTTETGRTVLAFAVKEKRKGPGTGGGGGTFLTGYDEDEDPREVAKRERQRQLALASQGQKNLRGRVQDKKSKLRDQVAGNRRHEEAMKELARRRAEQVAKIKAGKPQLVRATVGVSAGIRTKNKHLSEFQNIKDGYLKRKEDLTRKLRGTIPSKAGAAVAKKGVRAPPGIRLGSMSAPPEQEQTNRPVLKRAAPVVKSGTVTRRTQSSNPTRRVGGQGLPAAPGLIAVSGVGGVRNLKKGR